MNKIEQIIERFEKVYPPCRDYTNGTISDVPTAKHSDMLSFLRTELSSLFKELEEKIEGMSVEINDKTFKIMPEKYWRQVGANSVVGQVLALLKQFREDEAGILTPNK